jgi:hypothetical protein
MVFPSHPTLFIPNGMPGSDFIVLPPIFHRRQLELIISFPSPSFPMSIVARSDVFHSRSLHAC